MYIKDIVLVRTEHLLGSHTFTFVIQTGIIMAQDAAAPHNGMSARQYTTSRISTLKPPLHHLSNPIKLLRMLNAQQWAFFCVAFAAWVRSLSHLLKLITLVI